MKTISFTLFLCLIVFLSDAQYTNIDSLKYKISIAKEDTNKINLLRILSQKYTWSYADTSIMYAEQAMELAQKIHEEKNVPYLQVQMCMALTTLGNYPLALDYGFKALNYFEGLKNTSLIIGTYVTIGICYRDQGEYANGLNYFKKALDLIDKLNVQQAVNRLYFVYGTLSSVYERNDQSDSAIKYAMLAYEKSKDWSGILYVLGSAYSKKGNYDEAMKYYNLAIPAAIKSYSQIDLLDVYNGIAVIYKMRGNSDSAIYFAKKSLAEKSGQTYPIGMLGASTLLADIYYLQNKPDSAFKYLKKSISLKDSLYNREKTMAIQNFAFKEKEKQKEVEASRLKYQNRLRMYALTGGLLTLLIIAGILFKNNRRRQKAFTILQNQKQEIAVQKAKVEETLSNLKATQTQLIQSEKMASLGELTAGIAHEIQNPLNFVNNFSEVSTELIDDMNEAINNGNSAEAKEIAHDLKQNLEKINHHGKRAGDIVKGMLQHSRTSTATKELTNINALADEYLRLSYHGLRAKDKSFNATLKTDFDERIGDINIIPQDIGRVILNLITNAFYVVNEKSKQNISGYEPTVEVITKKDGDKVFISVKDNGNGITQKIFDKIFQPFFTTKPTGQGTGLGLSLSYDIVKAHGGEIKVETKENEGTEFTIQLPI